MLKKDSQILMMKLMIMTKNTHFSSLEDTPNEATLSVRAEMEKLGQHVKNQGAEILELKEKIRNMEREPNQRSLDSLPTHRDAFPVDANTSKRKRVYGTSPCKQLPMVDEQTNFSVKKSGFHAMNLQPSHKSVAPDKSKKVLVENSNAQQGEKNGAAYHNKETDPQDIEKQRVSRLSTSNKQHDAHNKNSKGFNATMLPNKHHNGSGTWLGAGPLAVGTTIFLKSFSSGHKDVALAIVVSCDPKYKLDGAEITKQFLAVHVNAALVKTEELVRKQKKLPESW